MEVDTRSTRTVTCNKRVDRTSLIENLFPKAVFDEKSQFFQYQTYVVGRTFSGDIDRLGVWDKTYDLGNDILQVLTFKTFLEGRCPLLSNPVSLSPAGESQCQSSLDEAVLKVVTLCGNRRLVMSLTEEQDVSMWRACSQDISQRLVAFARTPLSETIWCQLVNPLTTKHDGHLIE